MAFFQSEDLRLLREELETGFRSLQRVEMLRDECSSLAWRRDDVLSARKTSARKRFATCCFSLSTRVQASTHLPTPSLSAARHDPAMFCRLKYICCCFSSFSSDNHRPVLQAREIYRGELERPWSAPEGPGPPVGGVPGGFPAPRSSGFAPRPSTALPTQHRPGSARRNKVISHSMPGETLKLCAEKSKLRGS